MFYNFASEESIRRDNISAEIPFRMADEGLLAFKVCSEGLFIEPIFHPLTVIISSPHRRFLQIKSAPCESVRDSAVFIHYLSWTLSFPESLNKVNINIQLRERRWRESESAGGGREGKREREGWKNIKKWKFFLRLFSWRKISKVFSWTFTPLARVAARTSPLTLNTEFGVFPATRNI